MAKALSQTPHRGPALEKVFIKAAPQLAPRLLTASHELAISRIMLHDAIFRPPRKA
jgi:hypothetical protein